MSQITIRSDRDTDYTFTYQGEEVVLKALQFHIKCMIENDTLSAVTSPYATLGGDVWVLVNEHDEEAAALLIKDNRLECNPFN